MGEKTVVGLGVSRPFGSPLAVGQPGPRSPGATSASSARSPRGRSTPRSPTSSPTGSRWARASTSACRTSASPAASTASPNPFPEPTDVAELTLDSGTDTGVGFNLGLLASPTENLSFGLSYRHEVSIDHGAQANFVQILTGNKAVDDAVALALPASQPATVSFTYPGSIAAGVALRRGYWTVEADVQWMLWSSFDQVTIAYANSPAFDTVLPQEWASTWRGALGVEYLIGDDWEVRGGFGYDHSPAPTETISPFIHDADRYTFGGGGSWKYEQLRLDFNLRYVAFRTSSTLGISRYDYNGSYSSGGLQVGASLGYRF